MNLANLSHLNFIHLKKVWHDKILFYLRYYLKYTNVGYCTLDEPPRLMSMEQINDIHHGTWPSTCSTWLISLFTTTASVWITGISYFSVANQFSIEQVSPQTFIAIHEIHIPLNLMKTCTSTLCKFDNRSVNVYYVLWNIFSKIFSLRELHKFTKFSCCQCFAPYGS